MEPGGERTFLAYHGAEHVHRTAWFDQVDADDVDMVYVCGLEVEEATGTSVVEFLERRCAGSVYWPHTSTRISLFVHHSVFRYVEGPDEGFNIPKCGSLYKQSGADAIAEVPRTAPWGPRACGAWRSANDQVTVCYSPASPSERLSVAEFIYQMHQTRLTPGYTVGILQQELGLDDDKTVIENVDEILFVALIVLAGRGIYGFLPGQISRDAAGVATPAVRTDPSCRYRQSGWKAICVRARFLRLPSRKGCGLGIVVWEISMRPSNMRPSNASSF